MTNQNEIELKLNDYAAKIGRWRRSMGFHTPNSLSSELERDYMLGKLMLVTTEVSEAAEAVRHEDRRNFEEEIADTFIRLMDIVDACQINIEETIKNKMIVNEGRPFKHAKSCSL